MDQDDSPLGGPLELPGEESPSTHPVNKSPRRFNPKILIIILLVIVGLAGVGFGAYKLMHKSKPKNTTPTSTSSNSTTTSQEPTVTDVPTVTGTKDYKNTSLGVELTYPDGWQITVSDKASDGIKLESPTFNYETTDVGIVSGNFRVYIRAGARPVDSKYIGRGVAITSSQPLTYTSPLATQRKTTNLSLFGLDTPDQFAFFLIAGNFNLKKGDTLGPNYGKEPETILVTGGYSAKELKDDFQTNQVPLSSYSSTNAYKQAIDIVKSLKLQ
ncbi:MAG TPA: hypothetical protein VLF39_01830 [Candidatus Saccharimonadales bacterium]|nr:hypothetical protein [Candidatus Saccharimonadales bacterium]